MSVKSVTLGAVMLLGLLQLLLLATTMVAAKVKENLPKDAPLRIGVKHRPASCDRKSKPGDKLKMHYTGTLVDGTKFDSSRDRDDPFEFVLGRGMVIQGWDQGLNNMCVGEKRVLTIPSGLGYGDAGSGKIKGGDTLIFDVELMGIEDGGPEGAFGGEFDMPPDGEDDEFAEALRGLGDAEGAFDSGSKGGGADAGLGMRLNADEL